MSIETVSVEQTMGNTMKLKWKGEMRWGNGFKVRWGVVSEVSLRLPVVVTPFGRLGVGSIHHEEATSLVGATVVHVRRTYPSVDGGITKGYCRNRYKVIIGRGGWTIGYLTKRDLEGFCPTSFWMHLLRVHSGV